MRLEDHDHPQARSIDRATAPARAPWRALCCHKNRHVKQIGRLVLPGGTPIEAKKYSTATSVSDPQQLLPRRQRRRVRWSFVV